MTETVEPEAASLRAGDAHYRAFVGPPERYDLIAGSQFALLFLLGLRENHRLLDLGCGSLRLGRLAIPYLKPARYFGVEPEAWLIAAGFSNELGRDAATLKQPRFDHNREFRVDGFGVAFDFVMAQSVFSHTNPAMAAGALANLSRALAPGGLILANWLIGDDEGGQSGDPEWVYPGCVPYRPEGVTALASGCGLVCRPIRWFHPGLSWHVFARSEEDLPSEAVLDALALTPRAHPAAD